MSDPTVSPPSNQALYYATNTALVAAPVLLLIPPRKLDLYTLGLCTLWAASAEHQVRVRSGKSIPQWLAQRTPPMQPRPADPILSAGVTQRQDMPTGSHTSTVNEQIRRRIDPWAASGARVGFDGRAHFSIQQAHGDLSTKGIANRARLENATEVVASEPSDIGGVKELARQLWMGNEPPDWKEKRMREEQQAVEDGQSVSDRILGQIWAVWNQAHLEGDDARRRREMEEEAARELKDV